LLIRTFEFLKTQEEPVLLAHILTQKKQADGNWKVAVDIWNTDLPRANFRIAREAIAWLA